MTDRFLTTPTRKWTSGTSRKQVVTTRPYEPPDPPEHMATPRKKKSRDYPYETTAMLTPREIMKPVTVLKPVKLAYFTIRGKSHAVNTLEVLVHGESKPRQISVHRLEEKP